VAPGHADTSMVSALSPDVLAQVLKTIPAGRLATPAEIARGVALLVSDDAAYLNGITLSINGANSMA
jgi:acetoacetyl-CoA reductase